MVCLYSVVEARCHLILSLVLITFSSTFDLILPMVNRQSPSLRMHLLSTQALAFQTQFKLHHLLT